MTFYSIKYLETKGIEEFEGERYDASGSDYATAPKSDRFYFGRFERIDRDSFTSRNAAVEMGENRLVRKLSSLEKQRKKIEKLLEGLRCD